MLLFCICHHAAFLYLPSYCFSASAIVLLFCICHCAAFCFCHCADILHLLFLPSTIFISRFLFSQHIVLSIKLHHEITKTNMPLPKEFESLLTQGPSEAPNVFRIQFPENSTCQETCSNDAYTGRLRKLVCSW